MIVLSIININGFSIFGFIKWMVYVFIMEFMKVSGINLNVDFKLRLLEW